MLARPFLILLFLVFHSLFFCLQNTRSDSLSCGRAVAEIFLRTQNKPFDAESFPDHDELSLLDIACGIEANGVAVCGFQTSNKLEEVEEWLKQISGPVIAHCELRKSDQSIGHFVCIFPTRDSFVICDPAVFAPVETSNLSSLGLHFTGNWLVLRGQPKATIGEWGSVTLIMLAVSLVCSYCRLWSKIES